MKYLHYEWNNIGPEDVVEITLDKQANVRLIDEINYSRYRHGDSYDYRGGMAVKSPAHLSPPHRGHWHLVVDLEGYVGSVNVTVCVI